MCIKCHEAIERVNTVQIRTFGASATQWNGLWPIKRPSLLSSFRGQRDMVQEECRAWRRPSPASLPARFATVANAPGRPGDSRAHGRTTSVWLCYGMSLSIAVRIGAGSQLVWSGGAIGTSSGAIDSPSSAIACASWRLAVPWIAACSASP